MAPHKPKKSRDKILKDAGFDVQSRQGLIEAFALDAEGAKSAAEIGPTGNIITIDSPDNLTIPVEGGGVSQTTWDSINIWNTRGFKVEDLEGNRALIILDRAYLGLGGIATWCDNSAEIYDYDVWHEIADVDADCPYSTTTPKESWREWGLASNGGHAPVQLIPDGPWYRSNLYGDMGERLPASNWYQYIENPNTVITSIVQMLTVEEFLALPRPEPI